jgi:hypothetical protein
MKQDDLLPSLPPILRQELFSEFQELNCNFIEGRWRASGLNAGRFCEIVYCVLAGLSEGSFPPSATKPPNFSDACIRLESSPSLPKSFRTIMLPVLRSVYQVRNSRDIGHVGSDVDPSFMDGSLVVANAKWMMAEIIRHSHQLPSAIAQSVVDSISQYAAPYVWSDAEVRRVLRPSLTADLKILLLLSSSGGRAARADLFSWLDELSKSTFNRRVAALHSTRCIEAKAFGSTLQILPPGVERISSFTPDESVLAA